MDDSNFLRLLAANEEGERDLEGVIIGQQCLELPSGK